MPNWCDNELTMEGTPEDVEKVFEFMKTAECEFDFNQAIPYPQKYKEMDDERERLGYKEFHEKYGENASDGYNAGGYDWCIENWGTKWNACEPHRERDVMQFETAWSPPSPIVIALAKKFQSVSFYLEYFEGGMGFAGGFSCLSLESQEDYDYDEPFEAGKVSHEWFTNDYQGRRGG